MQTRPINFDLVLNFLHEGGLNYMSKDLFSSLITGHKEAPGLQDWNFLNQKKKANIGAPEEVVASIQV